MPTPSSGRESRRGSKSNASANEAYKSSSDRREKAKSSQIYDSRRRPSRQAESGLGSASARPQLKGRTNSAPLIDRGGAEAGARQSDRYGDQPAASSTASTTPRAGGYGDVDAQDEDEVAGVVGTLKSYQPFKSFEVRYRTVAGCKEHMTDLSRNRRHPRTFPISTLLSWEQRALGSLRLFRKL